MKKSSLLLVLSSAFLLSGCNSSTSIRPAQSDDTITTTVSIIDSDEYVSSLISGIKTKELQEIINNSKLYLDNIRTSIDEYAYAKYEYLEGYSASPTITINSLISKKLLYDNSVLYTTNTGNSYSDYAAFNFNNDEEKKLSSVKYITDDFKSIETRSIYQKDGEALKTVRISETVTYSQANYDKEFSLINKEDIIDAYDADGNTNPQIELSGVLKNGQTMVRFLISKTTGDEVDGYKDVNTVKVDYFFTNSLLTKMNIYETSDKEDAEGLLYPLSIKTISKTFSTTQNGKYDKVQLPELTKS